MFFFCLTSFHRCLGLKSPFIEFKPNVETLSNLSISLNTSDQHVGFANSMMSSNSFSYPLDAAGNHTVQKHYLDLVKKHHKWTIPTTENTIVLNAMNNKKEVTMIDAKEFLADAKRAIEQIDQKFIVPLNLPLALKSASNIMSTTTKTTTTTTATTTTTRKPPVLPDQSPNIDDLKRHILMLQNLTKNDENFQSKFVVFPSLRRNTDAPPSPATITMATTTTTKSTTEFVTSTTEKMPDTTTRRRTVSLNMPKQPNWTPTIKEETQPAEKITIVPQVFLQNDQTPMSDDNFQRSEHNNDDVSNYQGLNSNNNNNRNAHDGYDRRQLNNNNNKKLIDKMSVTDSRPTLLSSLPLSTSSDKRESSLNNGKNNGKSPKSNANHKRNDEMQLLRRQMRKKCKQAPLEQKHNCTKAFQISFNLTSATAAAAMRINKNFNSNNGENQSNVKNGANGAKMKSNYIPYRSKQPLQSINLNKMPISNNTNRMNGDDEDEEALKQSILQRTIRSHRRQKQQRRNTQMNSMSRRHSPYSIDASITTVNETVGADIAAAVYKEKIDLNPDFCYKVGGLSYGQQKLCATNTQIMPAISRGARAAIQVI